MLQQTRPAYNPATGYTSGSLADLVRSWAVRWWPDAEDDYNWQTYAGYYTRQYGRWIRAETSRTARAS